METQSERQLEERRNVAYSRLEEALKKLREKSLSGSPHSYLGLYRREGFLAEYPSSYVVKILTDDEKHDFTPPYRYRTVHEIVNKFYLGMDCIAYYDSKTKKPVIDLAFLSDPETKDADISSLVIRMNRYIGKMKLADHEADRRRKVKERERQNGYRY
ncbi:MAG: hypothetical protein QXK90_00830 [Candidatus Parvarchaeota archaeon]